MSVAKTLLKNNEIQTPLLTANSLSVGSLSITNMDSAYIKNLTVDSITVNDGETSSATESSETYESATFNEINLNFNDEYNCAYMMANEESLTSDIDGYLANIKITAPSELGAKLVCRYLVLDLRNLSKETVVGVVWPENYNIRWLYGTPDIQGGYFYVIAIQRFANDLFIGNVAVKLDGGNV